MLGKYINQLEDTAEKFNLEVQDVLELAEKYDKDIEKSQLEQKQLKQKMIDQLPQEQELWFVLHQ